jgi:hypothetical protein
MAKASGIGWTTLSVDDSGGTPADIKNDITNLQFATPRAVTDVTGINSVAIERLLLLADMTFTLNGQFNALSSHLVFRTVPSTTAMRTTSLTVNGVSLQGGAGPGSEIWYTDYSITRAQGGDLNWSSPGVLANGAVPTWA